MKILIIFFLNFLIPLISSEKARYDNYRVYEIFIENEVHLQLMKEIETFPDGVRFFKDLSTFEINFNINQTNFKTLKKIIF